MPSRSVAVIAAFASLICLAPRVRAEEPPAAAQSAAMPAAPAAQPLEAAPPSPAAPAAPAAAALPATPAPEQPQLYPPIFHAWPIPTVEKEVPKNWWLPPVEMVGFTLGLHLFNRTFNPDPVYDVTWEVIQSHFHNPWWYDQDKFLTNQFAHPYEGSIYYTTARSLGHGFWVSSAAAFTGSMMWELFAEAEPPSINDQITTTVAGSFLGEILFRLSNAVLDGGGSNPSGWRTFAATAISPITGMNHLIYGNKYRPSGFTTPPSYGEFRVGYGVSEAGTATGVDATSSGKGIGVSGAITYGLPGGDWRFKSAFDYFDISASLVLNKVAGQPGANGNFTIHGLLAGADYGEGAKRGLWGLFGTYDYITPQAYRVSSSSLGLGTVGQLPLSSDLVLTGAGILAIGYGSGGTLQENAGNRDYHFGAQATAYLKTELIWRDTLRLTASGRQYYISGKVSPEPDTWEEATYMVAGATWRIFGPHSVGAQWVGARRRAFYPDVPEIFSRSNEVQVFYSMGTDRGMGVGRTVQ